MPLVGHEPCCLPSFMPPSAASSSIASRSVPPPPPAMRCFLLKPWAISQPCVFPCHWKAPSMPGTSSMPSWSPRSWPQAGAPIGSFPRSQELAITPSPVAVVRSIWRLASRKQAWPHPSACQLPANSAKPASCSWCTPPSSLSKWPATTRWCGRWLGGLSVSDDRHQRPQALVVLLLGASAAGLWLAWPWIVPVVSPVSTSTAGSDLVVVLDGGPGCFAAADRIGHALTQSPHRLLIRCPTATPPPLPTRELLQGFATSPLPAVLGCGLPPTPMTPPVQ